MARHGLAQAEAAKTRRERQRGEGAGAATGRTGVQPRPCAVARQGALMGCATVGRWGQRRRPQGRCRPAAQGAGSKRKKRARVGSQGLFNGGKCYAAAALLLLPGCC